MKDKCEYLHECSEDEIEFLKFLIPYLQKRGFAWDIFLRPFMIKRLRKRIEYLKTHSYGKKIISSQGDFKMGHKAYYRYIKYCPGGQGTHDIVEPLTDWKPLEDYSDDEMNELEEYFDPNGWCELRLEVKIK